MHAHVCSNTIGIYDIGFMRRFRTVCHLQLRASEPTYTDVNIPHARGFLTVGAASKVVLDEYSSRSCTLSRNHHVTPLDVSCLTRPSNLNHGSWVVHVRKVGARAHNDGGQSLADNADIRRDIKGVRDFVVSSIDKSDDTLTEVLGDELEEDCESRRVVILAITQGAEDAGGQDEAGRGIGVLRFGSRVVLAIIPQRIRRREPVTRSIEGKFGSVGCVNIALPSYQLC